MISSNYSEVYSWFEKSGIISNIRTHLRQNLVNALKNNTVTDVGDFETDLRSAKQYVYDMLIAEYLLNYNYAYTLSVFSSEAPLLINIHKHAKVFSSNNTEKSKIKNKLPNDYVYHALQTLGIDRKNLEGKSILSQYAISESPLIICIIRYLVSNLSNKSSQEDICIRHRETQTAEYSESTKYRKSVALAEAKEKLYQQKELFSTQLKNKELELREQSLSIERQLVLLNEKLQHAQNLMHIVDVKENNLAKEKIKMEQILASRELELSIKEKLINQESDRLQKERDSNKKFTTDMKKLQEEQVKARNEVPVKATSSIIILKQDAYVQTDVCNNITNEMRLLKDENKELTSLIKEQQSRIEELTLRAITLARQLEEAQLLTSPKIHSSNNLVKHVNTIFSESSSTEDILQDAKMRLKRLEEESSRADQYYYNCITTSP